MLSLHFNDALASLFAATNMTDQLTTTHDGLPRIYPWRTCMLVRSPDMPELIK
jgi:hypothetical protein